MTLKYGESARTKWEFPLPVSEIRAAVDAKLAHHRSRLAWWQGELESWQAKLKSEGVTFRNYDHSGGRGVEAVIDPSMSRRVAACESRITHHTEQIEEYDAYAFGLARKGDGELLNMTPTDLHWAGFVGSEPDEKGDEDE